MRIVLIALAAVIACAPAVWSGEGSAAVGGQDKYFGSWRSLAYQLPGAYRFIDRLNLTEEQRKALDKISKDWTAQRQESYTAAMKSLPPLTPEEQKDPQKVKDYFAKRAALYKAADVPAPVDLVRDILTDEQLAKVSEAGKILSSWETWLAEHLGTYDKQLDQMLGPMPEDPTGVKVYAYQMFESFLPGGSLVGRLQLTADQEAVLQDIRKQYYAEYSSLLGPLGMVQPSGKITPVQMNAVRMAVNTKAWAELKDKARGKLEKALSEEQRTRLAKAAQVVQERDESVWKRYCQYNAELSAVLPAPVPAATTATSPSDGTKNEKPK